MHNYEFSKKGNTVSVLGTFALGVTRICLTYYVCIISYY